MYIVMNRFKVRPEKEAEFRSRWLDREVMLRGVPGFLMIQFMKSDAQAEFIPYASQTIWTSRAAFENWRGSDLFRAAHKDAGQGEPLTIEKREFTAYEVLRTVEGLEQAA